MGILLASKERVRRKVIMRIRGMELIILIQELEIIIIVVIQME